MNKAFKALFGPVRAEEALKDRTLAFLAERTRGYAGAKRSRRPLYAAACACLLLALLGGRWLYFTPTARISIDVNPSIELSVNRLDRVILVDGLNDDGRALSESLDVTHMNYAAAVRTVLESGAVAALLSGGEAMTITVVAPDGRQSAAILSGVEACAAGRRNTYCYSAPPGEMDAAREAGLSCGKYRAFLELRRLDPDVTPEAVRDMTMREILDLTARLSGTPRETREEAGRRGRGCGGGAHG